MKVGEPCFFSLFKRGKYYHGRRSHDDEEEAELERERREAERFAVAAVAFCLKYDERFRRHFWNKVCRQDGDSDLRPDALVTIEAENWSDLKIENGDCRCIVEFKIGADLEKKQNPNEKEFFMKDVGYGYEMGRRRIRRYTVLGYKEELGLGKATAKKQIICRECSWNDLRDGFEGLGSKLVKDLFDCLAKVGVWEFQFMKNKITRVGADIGKVSLALDAMRWVGSALDLSTKSYSESDEEGYWWLGFNVYRSGRAENTKFLEQITGGEYPVLAWFGFQGDGNSPPERAVWLHCGDKKLACEASKCFGKPSFAACRTEEGDPPEKWDVRITKPTDEGLADREWFHAVFCRLGLRFRAKP